MGEEPRSAKVSRAVTAGTVLYREGEDGDTMFVVQSGRVRLLRAHDVGVQWVGDVGPGEFFGEMAILIGRPRSATAEVIEDARLLELDARTFADLVRNNAQVALRLLQRLAQRLDQANDVIEVLIHRDPVQRVVTALARFSAHEGQEASLGAIVLPFDRATLAARCGLLEDEVAPVLRRLHRLQLVEATVDGLLVRDVMRLSEFLEFLAARESRAA